jgi:hypothetical protein
MAIAQEKSGVVYLSWHAFSQLQNYKFHWMMINDSKNFNSSPAPLLGLVHSINLWSMGHMTFLCAV